MSSTGCGSWIGSGSGYAFWCSLPLPLQHRAEPPMLTVVAVYALPSRTRWSWHWRWRTVHYSATSGWIESVEWLAFLSQSRFVTAVDSSGTEDLYSSGRVFSDLYLGRSLIFSRFLALCSARLLHICWQRKVVRDFPSFLTYFLHLNIIKSLLTILLTDY